MKNGILSFLFLYSSICTTAQTISKEDAFLFFMKVNGYSPENQMSSYKTFLIEYLETFKSYEWQSAKNDEFQKQKLMTQTSSTLKNKISSVDFSRTFTSVIPIKLGEYSFSNNSFPYALTAKEGFYPKIYTGEKDFTISGPFDIHLAYIVNTDDILKEFKISPDHASNFISSRKDSKGNVDRTAYFKIKYSMVNRKFKNYFASAIEGVDLPCYVYLIEVYSDPSATTNKLGEIIPSHDWYDKVNGTKIGNGKLTVYFNKDWKVIPSKSGASFYRELTYSNGKLSGPIKDYFISAKLQMTGYAEGVNLNYDAYGRKGTWTWYYENGNKASEVTYLNGKANGLYTEWWSNGKRKEEIIYSNGVKNGCYKKWKEDGTADSDEAFSSHKHWDYYNNGDYNRASTNCPCQNQ